MLELAVIQRQKLLYQNALNDISCKNIDRPKSVH